ncbi:hypothetical protein EVAR_12934_1 [Eumeta japonica]|uniref:Uncharacterized protein n=1 Tax=Eumeta variegata TaxID=151549 RepID=A0A4C1TVU6_EUMVA|nr:hypothetical protein EVAR_12934_1 [Eumeta japonica]
MLTQKKNARESAQEGPNGRPPEAAQARPSGAVFSPMDCVYGSVDIQDDGSHSISMRAELWAEAISITEDLHTIVAQCDAGARIRMLRGERTGTSGYGEEDTDVDDGDE